MLERAHGDAGVSQGERTGGLYSLGGVLLAAGLYSALHITARLIASGNLGEDDPLDAILTQTLALGYVPGQPPLYDWALWLIEQVAGPGALPFQLLKYGLLTATCGFIFLAARRVMRGDAFWAFLSVEALALIYQISWRFHEGFTHAVGAMCAVAATFWALLRLIERRGTADFALFGLCVGLGGADGEALLGVSCRADRGGDAPASNQADSASAECRRGTGGCGIGRGAAFCLAGGHDRGSCGDAAMVRRGQCRRACSAGARPACGGPSPSR